MSVVTVSWDRVVKKDGLEDATHALRLPAELGAEASVVLHGSRLIPRSSSSPYFSITTSIAVAFAEINYLERIDAILHVQPRASDSQPRPINTHFWGAGALVKVNAQATRVHFRSGEPIVLLHPFEDVERLFTAYRSRPE